MQKIDPHNIDRKDRKLDECLHHIKQDSNNMREQLDNYKQKRSELNKFFESTTDPTTDEPSLYEKQQRYLDRVKYTKLESEAVLHQLHNDEFEKQRDECTFQPNLSNVSRDICERIGYVPITERLESELERRQEALDRQRYKKLTEEEYEIQKYLVKRPDEHSETKRKMLTPLAKLEKERKDDMYTTGEKWMELRDKKILQSQKKLLDKEKDSLTFKPKLNKTSNNLSASQCSFHDRQANQIIKKSITRSHLLGTVTIFFSKKIGGKFLS